MKYLDKKGKAYTEINMDEQPEKRQEAFDLSGMSVAPVTVIDGDVVVGYNLGRIASLISQ